MTTDSDPLDAKSGEIKSRIHHLLAAHRKHDTKRASYWTGFVFRQLAELGRACLGLEPLTPEGIVQPDQGIITL